jgi:K+-sensing histidine kinase KdpD
VAQNAMQLKDSIFSIVSHDIRSPLLGLNYAAFGFRMGINEKDYNRLGKLVEHLEEKIGDMHFLVENFFYWANLIKGISIQNSSFDIQNEILHIIQSLEYKCNFKNVNIEITSQISGDKQNILYDRMVFGTVVRNILDNAIKFSPENSRIKVTLDYSKAQYIISFIDSGPGLSIQDAQRIFLNNRIGGNKSSLEKGGSGIGLSICKELMEAMGDKIECIGNSYGLFVLYINERNHVN